MIYDSINKAKFIARNVSAVLKEECFVLTL